MHLHAATTKLSALQYELAKPDNFSVRVGTLGAVGAVWRFQLRDAGRRQRRILLGVAWRAVVRWVWWCSGIFIPTKEHLSA
jgi:hypothetical protein